MLGVKGLVMRCEGCGKEFVARRPWYRWCERCYGARRSGGWKMYGWRHPWESLLMVGVGVVVVLCVRACVG